MTLIWLALAWLCGIAWGLNSGGGPGPGGIAWAGLLLVGLALLAPGRLRTIARGGAIVAVFALGLWRVALLPVTPATLPAGPIDAARGTVREWPERGAAGDTAIVAVDEVRAGGRWQGASATLRVSLPTAPRAGQGDRLEVRGPFTPTEEIASSGFRDLLRRTGVHGTLLARDSRILAVGERAGPGYWRALGLMALEERLRRHVPGAEGALVTGILLGDDNFLPARTRAAFAATSTSHIMALSGWNIAIIAGVCAALGRRLGRGRSRPWLLGSAAAIWLFVLFAGASPSLLRAALMASLYLLAEAVGRRGDALNALAVAASAMTALDPRALMDVGFQLSCAATVGLIVAAGPLARTLARWRLSPWLAAPIAATLAAEWFTLPLSLHYFGQVSRATLPANLLAEPLVAPIMAGGVLTALLSPLPGPLATVAGLLTWLPARALLLVVEGLGALPGVNEPLPIPSWPIVAFLYSVLGLACATPRWWPRTRAALTSAVARGRVAVVEHGRTLPWLPIGGGVACGAILAGWALLLLG